MGLLAREAERFAQAQLELRRLKRMAEARLDQAREDLGGVAANVARATGDITENVKQAVNSPELRAAVARAALSTTPLRKLSPVVEQVARDPRMAAKAVRQTVKEAAPKVRAQVRGFEDAVVGDHANAVWAGLNTVTGRGGEGDLRERYGRNLEFQQALDARDQALHPRARRAGRKAGEATLDTAEFGKDAVGAVLGIEDPKRGDRMEEFLRTREVEHPGLGESTIPVWGSAKEALADYQDGDNGGALMNAGLAVSDLAIAGAVTKGLGKAGFRMIGHPKPFSQNWKAVRGRMMRRGHIAPFEHGHHGIIPQGGWGKLVPDVIKNNPLNIKPMSWEQHKRIHGWSRTQNLPRYNLGQRIYFGMPDWFKGTIASSVAHPSLTIKRLAEEDD